MDRLSFALVACLAVPLPCEAEAAPLLQSSGQQEPGLVSLVQLIANPERFHGKVVRVAGYCSLEFEGNALYLHKEDFDSLLMPNSIALDFGGPIPEKYHALSNRYVLIEGRYSQPGSGISARSGRLADIKTVEALPNRSELAAGRK